MIGKIHRQSLGRGSSLVAWQEGHIAHVRLYKHAEKEIDVQTHVKHRAEITRFISTIFRPQENRKERRKRVALLRKQKGKHAEDTLSVLSVV